MLQYCYIELGPLVAISKYYFQVLMPAHCSTKAPTKAHCSWNITLTARCERQHPFFFLMDYCNWRHNQLTHHLSMAVLVHQIRLLSFSHNDRLTIGKRMIHLWYRCEWVINYKSDPAPHPMLLLWTSRSQQLPNNIVWGKGR